MSEAPVPDADTVRAVRLLAAGDDRGDHRLIVRESLESSPSPGRQEPPSAAAWAGG